MPPRLLLVEDDPTSRAFLLAATEALPAIVDVADSLATAIALAVAHDHASWLIDAHLPDGSGTQLLAELRARGMATPALAHTATHDREALDALLAAGFSAVVSKPLPAEAWRDAVRSLLGQQARAMPLDTQAPDGQAEWPVWDDAIALAALNGHRAHVDALRALFLAELPAMQAAAAAAFASGDADALLATLHKLRASCGFVGACRLDAAARALRTSPGSQALMSRFETALQDTLSS